MQFAYIVDALRLPRAVARKHGTYAHLKPVELLAPLYQALLERHQFASGEIDDLVLGCATQTGDQGANLAKISALFAGWDEGVSGTTVNRFCCSSLDAVNLAASKVMSSMESLVVAGGVEQVSRVPLFADKGAWFSDPAVISATKFMHMGVSADLIAVQQGYSRQQLDELAIDSHHKANAATQQGHFQRSLIPLVDGCGKALLDHDQGIRPTAILEDFGQLPVSFEDFIAGSQNLVEQTYPDTQLQALHTVGTSPGMADGASVVLIASEAKCRYLGLKPRARIGHFANASDEPVKMLTGHIKATEKLLKATGKTVAEIDLWEVNESFAASVLNYRDHFDIDPAKLNVNGSAIAMGHPMGATGGNLIGTLLDELERTGKHTGIVSICAGAGLGVSTLIERC